MQASDNPGMHQGAAGPPCHQAPTPESMLATGASAPITQFGTAWGRPRQAGKMRQNGGSACGYHELRTLLVA